MVYLQPGRFRCGGTLVADQYVVTAAHCLFHSKKDAEPMSAWEVMATIGKHDLHTNTGKEKQVAIAEIFIHEGYNAATSRHDIAVLKLAEEVDIETYTPACMAQTSDEDTFYGKTALAYGWGALSYGGPSSDDLLEVEVSVVPPQQCAASMGRVHAGQICAGGELGRDSCQV